MTTAFKARFPGTCAITGARFDAGTLITRHGRGYPTAYALATLPAPTSARDGLIACGLEPEEVDHRMVVEFFRLLDAGQRGEADRGHDLLSKAALKTVSDEFQARSERACRVA